MVQGIDALRERNYFVQTMWAINGRRLTHFSHGLYNSNIIRSIVLLQWRLTFVKALLQTMLVCLHKYTGRTKLSILSINATGHQKSWCLDWIYDSKAIPFDIIISIMYLNNKSPMMLKTHLKVRQLHNHGRFVDVYKLKWLWRCMIKLIFDRVMQLTFIIIMLGASCDLSAVCQVGLQCWIMSTPSCQWKMIRSVGTTKNLLACKTNMTSSRNCIPKIGKLIKFHHA